MTRNPYADGDFTHAPGLSAITNAHDGERIVSGCTPSKGSGDYDVDVASGTVSAGYRNVASVSATTKSLTTPSNDADLDSGEARVDIVHVDSTGTVNVTEGTAASGSKKAIAPDIPSGEVLVAAVFVDADASSLSSSDIYDYRQLGEKEVTTATDEIVASLGG